MPETYNVTVDLDRTGSNREGTDIDYASLGVTLDVSYFSDWETNARPVIVGVHGGAFAIGDKDGFDEGSDDNGSPYLKPEYFTNLGFPYVSINYRLAENQDLLGNISGGTVDVNNLTFSSPEWTNRLQIDDLISDVAAALKWVTDNAADWGFDATQMVLVGHSAGNHLIGGLGSRKSFLDTAGLDLAAIKGLILIDSERYDVSNILVDYTNTDTQGDWAFMNVYGVNPTINTVDFQNIDEAKVHWVSKSIIDNLNAADTPAENYVSNWCLVARGKPERIEESKQIIEKLEAKGIAYTYLEYPGTITDGVTAYTHGGIHKVLGGVDISSTNADLQALGIKNLSTEIGAYIASVITETPGPAPTPEPTPDPTKNIGRVIIARGDVPWDVKPPIWDDLVPPCCLEP